MYCYDENGNFLSFIDCVPKEGEEHYWEDKGTYICTGKITTQHDCENGMIFRKVS